MTLGFEERITAAIAATTSAAEEARSLIATEASAMSSAWTTVSAAADTLEAQRSLVASVSAEFREKLESLFSKYRDARPDDAVPVARLPAEVVSRHPQGGWVVDEQITSQLNTDLRRAQSLAREASERTFAGRQRREAREMASWVLETVRALEAEADRLAESRDELLARRDKESEALRNTADEQLGERMARLSEAMRRLPPCMTPWSNPSWLSWSPALTHSEVLLGSVRLRASLVPGKNHGFAWDARTPVFVSARGAMHLVHRRQDRANAHALARSILLRALASTPPGKLQLSVFDPTGLGQSVASLLELGEYDRDLIGGKVWTSGDDLHRLLTEQTAHIELVIQKYLRNEYATLGEFNADAGEIAEPYRLLTIFDAPSGFDERSFAELRRILENGPRCGVATLIVTDEDLELPHGISMESLPAGLQTVSLHLPFGNAQPDGDVPFDLIPETDAGAPSSVVASIIDQVGKSAQQSDSNVVTFEKTFGLFVQAALEGKKRGLPQMTAPIAVGDPETWWTQETVESVSAPIGQRGARDVATLTFDSSDHSGALLVGRPGSGKSTLLHTFIAGIAAMYGPEELELHLIDFKEGVEFKVYAAQALPHARTVAIESDREFGVSVLEAIQAEMTWRGSLLRGSPDSHSSLEALRKATGERLPRIVLIFDEFQVLFARNDKLGAVAAETLEALIRQGRGFGIHVLLGSQSLSGLDALGSHVPQLLPVRILLPAAESDAFKVLGEGNAEGNALTAAGEGILNMSGGAVEANERFRGAVIDEEVRRTMVAETSAKARSVGFNRRPVVFEGNAPRAAEDTPPAQFADELRGAEKRTLRLRFGVPMAVTGNADLNLRREAGANVVLVARDTTVDTGVFGSFSLPRAVISNMVLSAVAQEASVSVVDFLPIDEGLESLAAPLLEAGTINISRRRQVPELLESIWAEVQQRIDQDDLSRPTRFLVLYGMHRARDFDQDSVDYDAAADLPELLTKIMRDGPEVGVHVFLWFDTVAGISRRLPSSGLREAAWRLVGRMSADDSTSLLGSDTAASLREQQLICGNEDRGVLQRCTTITEPSSEWARGLLAEILGKPKEVVE